jgi:hypothetical protein
MNQFVGRAEGEAANAERFGCSNLSESRRPYKHGIDRIRSELRTLTSYLLDDTITLGSLIFSQAPS